VSAHWSERREGGGKFAVWLIITISLHLGRRVARVLMYPITLYFFFRRGPERRASRAFLTRVFGRPAGNGAVLRHVYSYATTVLDRVYLLSKSVDKFDVRVQGLDQLDAQMAHGRGVLLLGAHIGSFEVLRTIAARRPDVRVRALMDRQQTPAMTELLHALNPAVAAEVIDAGGDGGDLALTMHEAAKEGALIAMLADRARPKEKTCMVSFFGTPAPFPIAPYLIASALELPVVLCFGLYRGGNRYDLYFETFVENIKIARSDRAAQLAQWAQRFAARLEHYTRIDPYNWYNFYDFWQPPVADGAAVGEPAPSGG
jgi:predicted LPLAT superfamily acyltransferase